MVIGTGSGGGGMYQRSDREYRLRGRRARLRSKTRSVKKKKTNERERERGKNEKNARRTKHERPRYRVLRIRKRNNVFRSRNPNGNVLFIGNTARSLFHAFSTVSVRTQGADRKGEYVRVAVSSTTIAISRGRVSRTIKRLISTRRTVLVANEYSRENIIRLRSSITIRARRRDDTGIAGSGWRDGTTYYGQSKGSRSKGAGTAAVARNVAIKRPRNVRF